MGTMHVAASVASRSAGDESLEETGGSGLSKPGDKHRSEAAGDVARAEPAGDGGDRREVDDVGPSRNFGGRRRR
ncbi:hypothetical protein MTO96_031179 [Rhipicephalus appendiculatus]